MVATVLRLRYRILGNMLARSPWQLVGFVFGCMGAASALAVAAFGLVLIGASGLDAARGVVTVGGALLVIGWTVAPLVAGGVDTTVDAEQLAPFPLTTRQVMLALLVVGLAGVPGIATALGALSALGAWARWPVALVAALVCLPLGVLSCVLASRTVASFSVRGGRAFGNLVALAAFAALVLAGPILTGLLGLASGIAGPEGIADRLADVVAGVAWTPVGAVWAVPGDLAAGEWAAGLLKLLIAFATLGALWLLWRRNVVAASVSPRRRATGGRARRLGVFGWAPSGGTGATWARALRYWLTDPRYLRNLVIVALLPALFAFALRDGVATPLFAFSAVLPALLLGLVPYADVAFDGTAFATVLATGIRGRADRAGRLLAAMTAGGPLVVAMTVVTTAVAGRLELLPAVLGCAVGALLTGLGISAISSAYIVIPVPASGDNIFKRVPGQSFTAGLALMGFTLLSGALTAPAIVLAVVATLTGVVGWSWAALAVGIGVGVGVALAGIQLGGRVFDAQAPALLARVRATSGY